MVRANRSTLIVLWFTCLSLFPATNQSSGGVSIITRLSTKRAPRAIAAVATTNNSHIFTPTGYYIRYSYLLVTGMRD